MLNIHQRIKGIVTWTIIVMIGISFAFWGLTDYFSIRGDGGVAAKVNGQKLTWREIDRLYHRVQKQVGEKADVKAVKEELRTVLIQRTILLDSAKKLGFKIADLQIAQLLFQIPAFQEEGKFSKEKYLRLLGEAAYTDEMFRQELAQDMLLSQFEQGLGQSSFSLPGELSQLLALLEQRRDIGYVVVPMQKFKNPDKISADAIKSYFDAHQASFVVPEKVSLEYVTLAVEDLAKTFKPSDEEINAFYEENKNAYGASERVHARHILVAVPKGAKKEVEAKAKAEAESLLAKIQSGGDFEALAKAQSADTISAKKGGDLGWISKGKMVAEFEKAAFALIKPKEISGPIRSPYGYHLIQLIEHKAAETRPLKEVRDLVIEQLQREKGQQLFVEKSEQLAKIAFEESGNLDSLVSQLALKIRETEMFTRQGGKDKITKNPVVILSAFSEDILKKGMNSEPIRIDDNTLVVFRLKKYEAAKQQALTEPDVTKQIREKLAVENAQAKVKEVADSFLKGIEAGEAPSKIAKDQGLTWVSKSGLARNNTELDSHILRVAFETPRPSAPSKPSKNIVTLPNSDCLVLLVNQVKEGDIAKIDETTRKDYRERLADFLGKLEFSLYANHLMHQSKVEVAPI